MRQNVAYAWVSRALLDQGEHLFPGAPLVIWIALTGITAVYKLGIFWYQLPFWPRR